MSITSRVQKAAVTGVLAALVIVLGLTGLGFVRIPPLSLTIMHVPVIIGAIIEGPGVGLAVGFLFGVFSLVQTVFLPGTEAAFLNPLISILPRLFIGPAAWLVYRVLAGSAPRPRPLRALIAVGAGAFAGTLTNTVLVLGAIGLFKYYPWKVLLISALSNGLPEAALAVSLCLAVIGAWKGFSRGGRSRLSRMAEAKGGKGKRS